MNIKLILTELDELFDQHRDDAVEGFLQNALLEAKKEHDLAAMITLVNEMIGYYRDTGKYEEAIAYCEQVVALMKQNGYEGSVPYATTLLNVANAYRAAGKWIESEEYYSQVEKIYMKSISPTDYRYASLYNNRSLLYQEEGNFYKAKENLEMALSIISKYNNTQIEIATTHTNLATTLLRLGEMKEAFDHLIMALSIFEEDGGTDFHYSAALSAMGDAKYLSNDLFAAADYYEKAMAELEKQVGRTEAYERIAENLQIVKNKIAKQYPDAELPLEESNKEEDEKADEKMISNETSDQYGMQFYLETPSEDDFDDDYDVDVTDDFERRDYDFDILHLDSYDDETDDFDEYENDSLEETTEPYESKTLKPVEEITESTQQNHEPAPLLLELCEAYYREYGEPMIHNQFSEYEEKIAVGLVGEGSECFGFDDTISKNDGFGPGFMMWLDEETYEEIGEQLQKAYEALPKEYRGYRRSESSFSNLPMGVMKITEFYEQVLGISREPQSDLEWYQMETGALATATNGVVFRDDVGIFSGIRKKCQELYPERVHILRIAEEMTYLSQYGHHNYRRTMMRKDQVTAKIIVAQFMTHAMKMVYLLNRTYEPFYKWQRRGLKELKLLTEIGDLLDQIAKLPNQDEAWSGPIEQYLHQDRNENDAIQLMMEQIYQLIFGELKEQGYVEWDETVSYNLKDSLLRKAEDPLELAKIRKKSRERVLKSRMTEEELQRFEMMQSASSQDSKEDAKTKEIEAPVFESERIQDFIPDTPTISKEFFDAFTEEDFFQETETIPQVAMHTEQDIQKTDSLYYPEENAELVEKLVATEWKQFEKMQHDGNLEERKDSFRTFSIMRKSQYFTWPKALLQSYYKDLCEAEEAGWNLVMEKYARMMENTFPKPFMMMRDSLPVMSEDKRRVCEQIIRIQMEWMEAFAVKYPNMAGNCIHSYEDAIFHTSYETYLRAELETYSDETLALYGKMIVDLSREEKNLVRLMMTNTAILYGYSSLEEAEKAMSLHEKI